MRTDGDGATALTGSASSVQGPERDCRLLVERCGPMAHGAAASTGFQGY
jgi:hypothetical protein